MAAPFASTAIGTDGPAVGSFAITPADGTDLSSNIRALTIGTTAGVVVYDGWDGVTYTTGTLPVGTYALCARRIRSTGTTAAGLTGWV
jgi:L-asparaginase/Glu-tRNA(Gln) amidotransferase subunit D